ncbi:MAG: hypothetical protein HS108_07180 [Planctomycetes bacterium]|jgi:hypothetical protein|nr:hypothetical protein [Planctomycetota bacterium]MCL4729935.1 hypothetical protein [Planctomycetota bacterium]
MRRFLLAFAVLVGLCAALWWLVPRPVPVRAEQLLEQWLADAATAQVEMRGDVCWLEDYGIGIRLTPVPVVSSDFPRLLAGEAAGSAAVTAGLYDCGPEGARAVLAPLEAGGAKSQGSIEYVFSPRAHGGDIRGRSTALQLPQGQSGMLLEWSVAGRNFGLLLRTDGASALLGPRRDQLAREMIVLPGAAGVCPLLLDGRYACVLPGWRRAGNRFFADDGGRWLGLRVFTVALGDYADLAALQLELEGRLNRAGFMRSDGKRVTVAGENGFLAEYHVRGEGFVQRILYARLDGGYLVALLQAPYERREQLAAHAELLAQTIRRVDLAPPGDAFGAFFGRVRAVRCVAWQDGRRVLWGALFDDGRQQPVTWRQEGIEWQIQLTQGGMVVEDRGGVCSSSRELNPLVDSEQRALTMRAPVTGDVELILRVGTEKTTTRLTLR